MAERRKLVLRVDLEERYLRELREAFPEADFIVATDDAEFADVLGEADAVIGGDALSDEQLTQAKQLRWAQVTSAGVEGWLSPSLAKHPLTLTNFSGIAAPNIADHVIALMYAFARGLPELFDRQRRKEWGEDAPATFEPTGQTLAILGLGDIGEALAERASALGMTVVAMQRHPTEPPEGVDETVASDELPSLLKEADHVALSLPLTDKTKGMIGAKQLGLMKQSAYLYNVGRGPLIDQDALIAALREGRLAGAGLDVTDPEPLPSDSPLWELPNVIITGHNAAATPLLWERGIVLLKENVGHFLKGEELKNVVDTKAGY
ncbi:MAG TPA: D-2-hydroxyacid dehydrogenase [Thermomicrobiales bacterium]|jgi:phosphoglycerate dehydrogenase-like enzyme